jgi:hypothetical protein
MQAPPTAKTGNEGRRSEGNKFYSTARWMKFRLMILARNPMCLVLEHGGICKRKAVILHHIVSPLDDSSLALVTSNVVPCCREHHPSSRGTRRWVEGKDYTKTIGFEFHF